MQLALFLHALKSHLQIRLILPTLIFLFCVVLLYQFRDYTNELLMLPRQLMQNCIFCNKAGSFIV